MAPLAGRVVGIWTPSMKMKPFTGLLVLPLPPFPLATFSPLRRVNAYSEERVIVPPPPPMVAGLVPAVLFPPLAAMPAVLVWLPDFRVTVPPLPPMPPLIPSPPVTTMPPELTTLVAEDRLTLPPTLPLVVPLPPLAVIAPELVRLP